VKVVKLVVEVEPRVDGTREDGRVHPAGKEGEETHYDADHQQTEGLDPVLEGPAEQTNIAIFEPFDSAVAAVFSHLQQVGRHEGDQCQ